MGDTVTCMVDYERRSRVAPNHTMTHVLNYALRAVLLGGQNDSSGMCEQKGSSVDADRLRFDFSWSKPLTPEQVEQVRRPPIMPEGPFGAAEKGLARRCSPSAASMVGTPPHLLSRVGRWRRLSRSASSPSCRCTRTSRRLTRPAGSSRCDRWVAQLVLNLPQRRLRRVFLTAWPLI